MTEGKPVELGARAFDLLLVLVENHGRLVNKATLLDRVWPRLVVDENNLPTQIATLRRILGPAAIKTVPGFGYRLELSAEHGTGPDATPQPAKPPPAQSALTPRRTWPERLPSMIGRDDDVRAVHQALGRASLTTIVGGAGVGKTRLAQEVLSRETAGQPSAAVAWISLESIDNAQHVAPAIAMSLGLSLPEGRDQFIALRDALEEIPVLLIFDGIEHLAETLALPLAMLLSKTRGVRALVTSQVPLRIPGEIVYRLAARRYSSHASFIRLTASPKDVSSDRDEQEPEHREAEHAHAHRRLASVLREDDAAEEHSRDRGQDDRGADAGRAFHVALGSVHGVGELSSIRRSAAAFRRCDTALAKAASTRAYPPLPTAAQAPLPRYGSRSRRCTGTVSATTRSRMRRWSRSR